MKPSILRFAVPLALAALLVGCGGGHDDDDCIQAIAAVPNPAYAGVYTGTYTPGGDVAGGGLEFILTVATNGTVTGTVYDPSTNPRVDATVTGTVGDRAGCGGRTDVALTYAYADGHGGTLNASRSKRSALTGTYTLDGGATLVLRTAATAQ